ncbi:MAG TPA: hypothetical protein VG347_10385 [Verrucomicrobiae bacterium]|nr:hypothetical protein [Verrucomicrobiae bacterium]
MNCAKIFPWKFIRNGHGLIVLFFLALAMPVLAVIPDFIIETPNGQFDYRVNGVDNNPTITLLRGHTYTFLVTNTASFHPCAFGDSVFGNSLPGVTGDNTSAGLITYNVPIDATGGVYYCSIHGFSGTIQVMDAPTPTIQITGLTVNTNLTLTAAIPITNGLTLIPEFRTNLLATNWFGLTVRTNRYFNGTNEAICGKPAGNAVFIRIRADQN